MNIILKIKVSTERFNPADKPIVAPPYYALCQLKAVFPVPHPPVSPPVRYLVCGARHRDPVQKAPRLGANLLSVSDSSCAADGEEMREADKEMRLIYAAYL